MGVTWLAQVRFVHLLIFATATIPILLCFSYLNNAQLRTTPSPLRSYVSRDVRMLQANQSQQEKGERGERGGIVLQRQQEHNNNNSSVSVTSSEAPAQGQAQAQPQPPYQSESPRGGANASQNQIDLTRGVAAEIIYEAGHADVSSQICPDLGGEIRLLIAITSAPGHDAARLAIRETWGHFAVRKDVAIAFMLGSTPNETLTRKVESEQKLYGDIIVGNFIDTYDNLTLKTISILEWVDNYCPKAAFVLKTDDDMFINVSRLLAFIAKHSPEQRAIYGRLAKKWKVIRNKKSKYYISPQQYKPAVFPDFTTGPAYLFPANLSKELYVAALNHPYFRLEDVFLTGIVANELKIKRVHAPEFLNKRVSLTPCNVQKEISIHMVKSNEQYELWKKLHDIAKCKK